MALLLLLISLHKIKRRIEVCSKKMINFIKNRLKKYLYQICHKTVLYNQSQPVVETKHNATSYPNQRLQTIQVKSVLWKIQPHFTKDTQLDSTNLV